VILIAGGTGRLGTLVVRRLARDGVEVRVLTRDAARAQHLSDSAVEIVVGDVRDPSTLPHAMREVTTVVSAVHGFDGPGRVSPASVDRDGNAQLVDAAAAAGADVVLMSVVGASADSPMELFRAKYAAEQHLRASTARWTIVRATAFIELWAQILAKPIVFGRGNNPINFVSVHDVAAVVARAVVDPGLRGQTIDVGGPDNLTMNQLVAELQSVRGDTRKVRHIPRAMLRAMAPMSRRAAAAVAMDTVDLTFHPVASAAAVSDLPLTDSRTALRSIAG
jgi:NADH dehydrogenase